jgi:hypothetical protein
MIIQAMDLRKLALKVVEDENSWFDFGYNDVVWMCDINDAKAWRSA